MSDQFERDFLPQPYHYVETFDEVTAELFAVHDKLARLIRETAQGYRYYQTALPLIDEGDTAYCAAVDGDGVVYVELNKDTGKHVLINRPLGLDKTENEIMDEIDVLSSRLPEKVGDEFFIGEQKVDIHIAIHDNTGTQLSFAHYRDIASDTEVIEIAVQVEAEGELEELIIISRDNELFFIEDYKELEADKKRMQAIKDEYKGFDNTVLPGLIYEFRKSERRREGEIPIGSPLSMVSVVRVDTIIRNH